MTGNRARGRRSVCDSVWPFKHLPSPANGRYVSLRSTRIRVPGGTVVLRALIAGLDPADQRGARPCVAAVPGLLTAARRSRSLIGWLLLAGYG